MANDLNIDRINHEASEDELDVLSSTASKIVYYPIPVPKDKPYWFEAYAVEDKATFTFLGIIGRLGSSQVYEYDNMFSSKGKGRARSLPAAIMQLLAAMEVESDLHE